MHIDNMHQMIDYCQNRIDCRRVLLAMHFNEKSYKSNCRSNKSALCDNCLSTTERMVNHHFSNYCNIHTNLYFIVQQSINITDMCKTIVYLIDGLSTAHITLQQITSLLCRTRTLSPSETKPIKLKHHGLLMIWRKIDVMR